jgi:hypothetical protein
MRSVAILAEVPPATWPKRVGQAPGSFGTFWGLGHLVSHAPNINLTRLLLSTGYQLLGLQVLKGQRLSGWLLL